MCLSLTSYIAIELVTAKIYLWTLLVVTAGIQYVSVNDQRKYFIISIRCIIPTPKKIPLKLFSINCIFFSCSWRWWVSCLSHCNLMCSSADSNSRIMFFWCMDFISCSSICTRNFRSDSRRPTILERNTLILIYQEVLRKSFTRQPNRLTHTKALDLYK